MAEFVKWILPLLIVVAAAIDELQVSPWIKSLLTYYRKERCKIGKK